MTTYALRTYCHWTLRTETLQNSSIYTKGCKPKLVKKTNKHNLDLFKNVVCIFIKSHHMDCLTDSRRFISAKSAKLKICQNIFPKKCSKVKNIFIYIKVWASTGKCVSPPWQKYQNWLWFLGTFWCNKKCYLENKYQTNHKKNWWAMSFIK